MPGNTNPLDGLDDIPWGRLSHAYAGAGDVPSLLRAIAAGEVWGEEYDEKPFFHLTSSICHQGSVYEATPHAVPFLARLAAAGISTRDMLGLLGWIAESTDERGLPVPGSARSAVAAQASVLAPLLRDPAPEIRSQAAWVVGVALSDRRFFAPLRGQWQEERDPVARSVLLTAMAHVAPGETRAIARQVAADADGAVERLVAAWACVASGVPWEGEPHAAATAWFATGIDLPSGWWGDVDTPFAPLLCDLADRGDFAEATALALEALGSALPGEPFATALREVERFVRKYRVPVPALAAALIPRAGIEEAAWLLRQLPPTRDTADALCEAADVRGPSQGADDALSCLAELGDPRAAGLLARDVDRRPETLEAIAPSPGEATPVPFDAGLLDALRAALRTGSIPQRQHLPLRGGGLKGSLGQSPLIPVLRIIAGWGPQAAAAAPELTALLGRFPLDAGRALAAIAGPLPEVLSALRHAADPDAGWLVGPLQAGESLRDLTGDEGPLLTVIQAALARGREHDLKRASDDIATLASPPLWLLPAIKERLARLARPRETPDDVPGWTPPPVFDQPARQTLPEIGTRMALGRALRHLTGDPSLMIQVIGSELTANRHFPHLGSSLARAARDMGADALPLTTELRQALDDPASCPMAAQALLRISPEELDLANLASRLVDGFGAPWHQHADALDALREIRERAPEVVSADLRARLGDLADSPQRVSHSRLYHHAIRGDESLRSAIREFLAQDATAARPSQA